MQLAKILSGVLIVVSLLSGCSSTPVIPDANSGFIIKQPLEKAHQAAVDALTYCGFDITKDESSYVEGARPRKIGLVVGSGGETVGIWLFGTQDGSTKVLVKTAKSFVGMVGQKRWEDDIRTEMLRTTGQL